MTDNLRDRIAKAVFDGFTTHPSEYLVMSITDSVIRQLLPNREGRWGWIDGTVSTNHQTGNPIKLEIEPGEVNPLSVEDALQVGLALLSAVIECEGQWLTTCVTASQRPHGATLAPARAATDLPTSTALKAGRRGTTISVRCMVTDSLRDRIKEEVLDGILSMFSENDPVEMAAGYITDAVIEALGLTKEDEYNPYDPFPPAVPGSVTDE